MRGTQNSDVISQPVSFTPTSLCNNAKFYRTGNMIYGFIETKALVQGSNEILTFLQGSRPAQITYDTGSLVDITSVDSGKFNSVYCTTEGKLYVSANSATADGCRSNFTFIVGN